MTNEEFAARHAQSLINIFNTAELEDVYHEIMSRVSMPRIESSHYALTSAINLHRIHLMWHNGERDQACELFNAYFGCNLSREMFDMELYLEGDEMRANLCELYSKLNLKV